MSIEEIHLFCILSTVMHLMPTRTFVKDHDSHFKIYIYIYFYVDTAFFYIYYMIHVYINGKWAWY